MRKSKITAILVALATVYGTHALAENAAPQDKGGQAQSIPSTLNLDLLSHPIGSGSITATQDDALTYQVDPEVRQRDFAQFVDKSRAQNPQGADQLEQMLTSQDVMAAAQKWLDPYNMHIDNVADAVAVYLVTAWYTIQGSTDDPKRDELRAVRDQVAGAMLAVPAFREASDAVKQEMSEANLLQAMLVGQFAEAAKQNPALQAQVADAVAQGVRNSFKLDMKSVQLTDRGFVAIN